MSGQQAAAQMETTPDVVRGRVNIRRLKEFALDSLPKGSPLRDIILLEEDELDALEFLAKLPLWLRLLRPASKSHE